MTISFEQYFLKGCSSSKRMNHDEPLCRSAQSFASEVYHDLAGPGGSAWVSTVDVAQAHQMFSTT